MLNRRIIRMKAFQYLFAYEHCREANLLLGQDLIDETFQPNLMAEIPDDKALLESNKKQAIQVLDELAGKKPKEKHDFNNEVFLAADKALRLYIESNNKDKAHLLKVLIAETELVQKRYLLILLLVNEVVDLINLNIADKDIEALRGNSIVPEAKFLENKVANYLLQNKKLIDAYSIHNVTWVGYHEIIRAFYSELRKNEKFKAYLADKKENSFEEDKEVVSFIIKEFAFQNQGLMAHFEDQDINWVDNKAYVKSMVSKTLKLIDEQNPQADIVTQLSADWEEDKRYMVDLYTSTLANEKEYIKIIEPKLKNWNLERLADSDELIIKMAMVEFFNYLAIPTKVTINEYIEVAKHYSTPKSKQFVNGMLDKLAVDLVAEGKIKKSGRGLL